MLMKKITFHKNGTSSYGICLLLLKISNLYSTGNEKGSEGEELRRGFVVQLLNLKFL